MMVEMNKAYMLGNLTRDPQLKYTKQNVSVTNLRMAINRTYFSNSSTAEPEATPTKKSDAIFVTVIAWGRTAENACQYLKKGSPILVEGFLQSREWEKDGVYHSVIEVVADKIIYLARDITRTMAIHEEPDEGLDGEGEEGRG